MAFFPQGQNGPDLGLGETDICSLQRMKTCLYPKKDWEEGSLNVMKFSKPILSPRNMIRIIEGVMESGRGRGHGPPPFILIVISF